MSRRCSYRRIPWRQHPQTPPSPTPSTPPSHSSPPSVMEGYSRSMSVPEGAVSGSTALAKMPQMGLKQQPPQQQQPQSQATPPLQQQQQQQQQPQGPQQQVQRPTALGLDPSLAAPLATAPLTDPLAPTQQQQQTTAHTQPRPQYRQQKSMPVTRNEFNYYRSNSRTEAIKNKLKKETAMFFGVHEETEASDKAVWLGRRRRLASRKYGNLKPEYADSTQPDVLLSNRDEADSSSRLTEPPSRQKPSVAKMTLSGMAFVVSALNRHRSRDSHAEDSTGSPPVMDSPIVEDDVFFDTATDGPAEARAAPPADFVDQPHERNRERHGSWRRAVEGRGDTASVGMSRIYDRVLDKAHDNSNRRAYGMGILHRIFGRTLKRSVTSREPVKEQLEDLEDHRPFFTYWVTTVQILILVISIACYGFGPIGFGLTEQSGLVLVTSLSLQQVDYTEPASFWLGPRAADLIHLGAKFAPCMRRDAKIIKEIDKSRERERETACCIRNDDSGCVQSSKTECSLISTRNFLPHGLTRSKTIATWKKWTPADAGPGGRISGSVCGLDPKYCEAPASVAPYEWPDDITKWPICRKTSGAPLQKERLAAEHMVCEVIGHPCCIGIHAQCRITTKEYCDFVHGYFHDEASLCSQVSCLDNVCGMMSFYYPDSPDQFYRLFTSLFLHAGVLHLLISITIQWFWMRDLEKLTGPIRIMIIYLGSGIGGNLASAIFVPYRADVGPAGSQFGLLACYIVEVILMWPMLKHPQRALLKLLTVTLVLFVIGLLPWVDNFSHLFGFIFGFLLSCAFMPFVSFGEYDRQKKIFLIWVCIITTGFLFLLLVLFFYIIPVYDCEICNYLNCLPLTRDFCNSHNINFKRSDHIV